MGKTLLLAFALMLVIEGILPFVAPENWRNAVSQLARLHNGQIRFIGLASMLIGLLLLIVFS